MTEGRKSDQFNIPVRPDSDSDKATAEISPSFSDPHLQELEDAAEDLGFTNKSAAYRAFLTIGMNAIFHLDPRNDDGGKSGEGHEPLTLRDVLPDSKENALNMREGELLDKLDDRLATEIAEDPAIKQEGWKVWSKK
jgi:hypothetical protein